MPGVCAVAWVEESGPHPATKAKLEAAAARVVKMGWALNMLVYM